MSLQEELDRMTRPGVLAEGRSDGSVQCFACGHQCLIKQGRRGVCEVRFNDQGTLRVPWGYVSSLQVDPIEKKPFYHFLAGSDALTFGMLGCNLKCGYCQNWLTSQALREDGTERLKGYLRQLSPTEIISYGLVSGAEVVASSYNEPLITSEWAGAIFQEAILSDLKCVYVSNGFASEKVLDYLNPVLSGFKVDLKSMQGSHYRELGGRLQPVLDSIKYAHELGLWVEIVTLLVPGFNDSQQELEDMADFILSVSPDIPWHISAFRPDYKMTDRPGTSHSQVLTAVELGYKHGIKYVYGGNLPGMMGKYENTNCHNCGEALIKRTGYLINQYRITNNGTCPDCGTVIPGIWTNDPKGIQKSRSRFPRFL